MSRIATSSSWSILAYTSLALAVMTKGFIGFFPLVVMAVYLWLVGRFHAFRALISLRGGMLFVLLIVPWHLIIGWQNEGYFWHYFANEHFLRFLGRRHPIDFVSLPLPIFFLVLFLWLLPWSPYLALAIPRKWPAAWETASPRGRGVPLCAALGRYVPHLLLLVAGAFAAVFPASDASPGAADRHEPR